MNTERHAIPGATDAMQHLERYVFGAMKASYSRIYRARVAECGIRKLAKGFVIQLLAAWEAVTRAIPERAWEIDGTE
jgi:hypothetical protein